MQQVNEFNIKLSTEAVILQRLDEVQQTLVRNGVEVRKALAEMVSELKVKQDATGRDY